MDDHAVMRADEGELHPFHDEFGCNATGSRYTGSHMWLKPAPFSLQSISPIILGTSPTRATASFPF